MQGGDNSLTSSFILTTLVFSFFLFAIAESTNNSQGVNYFILFDSLTSMHFDLFINQLIFLGNWFYFYCYNVRFDVAKHVWQRTVTVRLFQLFSRLYSILFICIRANSLFLWLFFSIAIGIRYGKYCGVGWSGCAGEKPCDDLDACCKIHDECVEKNGTVYFHFCWISHD